jgi:hypothetical protein
MHGMGNDSEDKKSWRDDWAKIKERAIEEVDRAKQDKSARRKVAEDEAKLTTKKWTADSSGSITGTLVNAAHMPDALHRRVIDEALTAYERGDALLQVVLEIADMKPTVGPMSGTMTETLGREINPTLNAICATGWTLHTASFVSRDLGFESRDKFMASGQQVAFRGEVLGYYIFSRHESDETTGIGTSAAPGDLP